MPDSTTQKFCDIVMKGGITSGIVYPPVVAKLAEIWAFKNIGGTSAGAIAAAATAAAQYGKNKTGEDKFAELGKVPTYLAETTKGVTRLQALFQPQAATRGVFAVLLTAIERGKWRAILTLLRHFWRWALAGSLVGLLLLVAAWNSAQGWFWGYASLIGLLVAAVGAIAFSLWRMVATAQRVIPENFYGFCKGLSADADATNPQLTDWLHGLLNRLADLPAERPLTFGDLWGADETHKVINLEMMTTSLTHGRPYRLPFEQSGFLYHPQEFAQLFPASVVNWMNEHSEPHDAAPLRKLPKAVDLPVIVATRMSLSFPLLLSAVPLYAVDFTRKDRTPERCWFSDGGICSNFPVHFFDTVLPMHPSFAVNLKPFHPDFPDGKVYMPKKNSEGIMTGRKPIATTGNFLSAILEAMQNWNDNVQLPLPGYRDRIVHICLNDESEGGLNLNMPANVIADVAARGDLAAAELIARYDGQSTIETNWENHRWVRFRSTMAQLEALLQDLLKAYETTAPGEASFAELLARDDNTAPNSYRWKTEKQYKFAEEITTELLALARKWRDPNTPSLQEGAPRPAPELRVKPRL